MYITNPEGKKYAVFVLGAGGTGSWLCTYLDKLSLGNNVIVIDGDIVEPKNVLRQNFKHKHINHDKAVVTAIDNDMSYVNAFLTDTLLLHNIMKEFDEDTIPVIVGCLDNNATRKIAHDFLNQVNEGIWIDGGNAERHGQIYVTIKENGEFIEGFRSPLTFDEALMNFEGDERRPDQISCAEQSESAPQNVTANVMSATILFNCLVILLTGGAFVSNKYVFDTSLLTVGY